MSATLASLDGGARESGLPGSSLTPMRAGRREGESLFAFLCVLLARQIIAEKYQPSRLDELRLHGWLIATSATLHEDLILRRIRTIKTQFQVRSDESDVKNVTNIEVRYCLVSRKLWEPMWQKTATTIPHLASPSEWLIWGDGVIVDFERKGDWNMQASYFTASMQGERSEQVILTPDTYRRLAFLDKIEPIHQVVKHLHDSAARSSVFESDLKNLDPVFTGRRITQELRGNVVLVRRGDWCFLQNYSGFTAFKTANPDSPDHQVDRFEFTSMAELRDVLEAKDAYQKYLAYRAKLLS